MAQAPGARDRDWTTRLVVWAGLLLLLVIFVAENFLTVEVRLLVVKTETRLAWALIIAAGLGFLVGFFFPRRRGKT